jgi:hypothetical protein
MTQRRKGFTTKRTLRKGEIRIRVANDIEAEFEAIGDLLVTIHTGFTLLLKNNLCVPSM